jgi:hypothetical protein
VEERGVLRGGLPDVAELLVALVGHGASRVVGAIVQKGKFSAAASALSPRRLKSEDLPTLRVRARGGGGVRVNGAQCAVRVERVWARRRDGGSGEGTSERESEGARE